MLQVLDLDRSTPQGLNLGFQRERVYRPECGKELPEALRPNPQKFKVMATWAQSGRSVCPGPTSSPSTPHSVTDSLNDSPGQSTPKW